MANISSVIKAIQDIMRKDTGINGDAQRLSQIVWILFLKIFADKEEELALLDDNYKSPIPENLRWQNWAIDEEGITGDKLINFIDGELIPGLKQLQGTEKENLIAGIFQDTYNYMKSGTLLRQVINKINEIDFNSSSDRHLFNDIYEQLLQSLQSAGNAGEFYTPRPVTQFIVEMVNPKIGEKILDPANGTGGFLTCSIEHLRKQEDTTEDREKINNNINEFLESQQTSKFDNIDKMLESLENAQNSDEALNILTEAQKSNSMFNGYFAIENMPAQYRPLWESLSEERQIEIARQSRMYDFTKAGILESFWAGINFENKPKQVNESKFIGSDYHMNIAKQMAKLRR